MGRIGYACLTLGVPYTNYKSCIMKNASEQRLTELSKHNLMSLENIIDYNINNEIRMFRISSDVIPFGSSPVNTLDWDQIFKEDFIRIGRKIKEGNIRVSLHPGQYTVLNSPNSKVVSNAMEDLRYHDRFLKALGCDFTNKIILHIGGVYGNRELAVENFKTNFRHLDTSIKNRLVIENDDRSYPICDVLEISKAIGIPVVYDNLHNKIKSCVEKDDAELIELCSKSWNIKDGQQKIHYSQQNSLKQPGAHTKTISVNEFLNFYKNIKHLDVDIMLEVKDKNVSAIKCINLIKDTPDYRMLQKEWARYKYIIMEKSPADYSYISKLFGKGDFSAEEFYNIIEQTMMKETHIGPSINALEHVWGYFKNEADKKELARFKKSLILYKEGNLKLITIKNFLYKLAVKYQRDYLLYSRYFDE